MNEAERLAKELEEDFHLSYPSESMWKGAEELRRLSAINAELVEALKLMVQISRTKSSPSLTIAKAALEKAKQ